MVAVECGGGVPLLAPALPREGFVFTLLSGKRKTCSGLLWAFTAAPQGMEQGSGGPEGSQYTSAAA